MKRIFLITHTEAAHTVDKKVGGWFDAKLTTVGKQQAGQILARIAELGFDITNLAIYCSDLSRATQTAQILSKNASSEPIVDARLREMSFGTHEGMAQQDHNKIMIPVSPTGNRLDHRICNGAESRREVATRIAEFVEEIMKVDADTVVVTHGFAATFFIAAFQKIDVSSMGYINYKLHPGSISILEADDLFQNRTVRLLNA